MLLRPAEGIAEALGAASVEYNQGIALYLVGWAMLVLIYLIASLRTNAVYVLVLRGARLGAHASFTCTASWHCSHSWRSRRSLGPALHTRHLGAACSAPKLARDAHAPPCSLHSFWLLVSVYVKIGKADVANLTMILKVAGAFAFLTCLCGELSRPSLPPSLALLTPLAHTGWYLLVVLVFGSTGIPVALPVGDMSNFMSGRRKERSA